MVAVSPCLLNTHSDEAFTSCDNDFSHLLNSLVVPRPIAFVTTKGENGVINAAPFSYFNVVNKNPPLISLAIQHRDGKMKDTARNIFHSKEFVVNICSIELAKAINLCAQDFPPHVSEIDIANLSLIPSHQISVPRIANTLAQMECELFQNFEIADGLGNLILGKVVVVHLHKKIVENGRVNIEKLNPIARLSGAMYAQLSHFIDLSPQ